MERAEIVVLDTHTWVWWVSNPEKLSKKAKQKIDESSVESSIFISSMSVWEITMLVLRGRAKLTLDADDWISRSEALPFFQFVPVDNLIARKANNLPNYAHRDPADRMIIATALVLGGTLITGDEKILNYPHVLSLW